MLVSMLLLVNFVAGQGRITLDFGRDWRFYLGNDSLAATVAYNDSSWRVLDLPHDWSIEGEFSSMHPGTSQQGALPTGIGWYRKQFVLPVNFKKKLLQIEFDGVYRNSEVWLNGHYLGKRPSGYISFSYDITKWVKEYPQKNILSVKVDNSAQPSSRWYTGSGIYRNVRLVAKSSLHITSNGMVVTTPLANSKFSSIKGAIRIEGGAEDLGAMAELELILLDHQGKVLQKKRHPFRMQSGIQMQPFIFNIQHPRLWSPQDPNLYALKAKVYKNQQLQDEQKVVVGLREFRFDSVSGFILNGRREKIKGVCMHHDLGALGAAVNVSAIQRQLQLLKKMGCNAIRTAHNPPSPEFLDLCDRMGFLVMVEAFDMWKKKKNKFDYYLDFPQWHEADLIDMILRDRNHPSVFMWSVGNEIREQFDSTGIPITQELVRIIKDIDTTRPVTAGLSEWNPEKNFMYKSGALDVVGLNYHHEVYEDFKKHYPGDFFLGAENMSALASRGVYPHPSASDSLYHWPDHSPQKFVENGFPDFTVSSYDQVSAYWGTTHEQTWGLIKKYDFMSGLFVWSGFDFLGEPLPYPWPARSSYYGIIDLAGFPKDVYHMYRSEWSRDTVLHLLPHWNWTPGQLVDVWAYYNHADEVELFLNGKSQGIKSKAADQFHVKWTVAFEVGELKAVSRRKGKIVRISSIETTGKPAGIKLETNTRRLDRSGKELAFVEASLVDSFGRIVPESDQLLEFQVLGAGKLLATDNGYQADTVAFHSSQRKTWKGRALGIVETANKKGKMTVVVKGIGLKEARINLVSFDGTAFQAY